MNTLVAIALSSIIAAQDPKAQDPKVAQEAFQGAWKLMSWAKLGRDSPKEKLEKSKVVVKDDALSMTLDGRTTDMTFTLDPKADPPALDFRSDRSNKVIRGIYKLEKDKITICFGIENSPRPTEFKAGGDNSIMVMERVKKLLTVVIVSEGGGSLTFSFVEESDMLKGILQSLFGSPPVRAPFNDPVLGSLEPGETGWTANVVKGPDHFEFTIGGIDKPDDALLAHAHDILGDYLSFKKAVKSCVEYESRDYPAEVKAELAGLEIDNVALYWPARPNDGMIFFRGSEKDVGLWRCDYIKRKPTGLGCDT